MVILFAPPFLPQKDRGTKRTTVTTSTITVGDARATTSFNTITTTDSSNALETVDWVALTQEIEAARQDWTVPGVAVGVVYKGELVYSAGFGKRNDDGEPVTADTVFQIGSTTKAFTAFGLATLVDDKKLDWSTPITSLAPVEFQDPFANKHANMIDLLTHRTGLPSHDNLMTVWSSVKKANSKIKFLKPSKQFREKFQYNNGMYNLAGWIGGKLHGSTWDDLVSDKILKPLGMTNTYTNLGNMAALENHSRGHIQRKDKSWRTLGYEDHGIVETSEGDGSMLSSVNDMAKWVALMNKKGITADGKELISRESFDAIVTPRITNGEPPSDGRQQLESYGLGWEIYSRSGKMAVGHSGGMMGYVTQVRTFPNDDIGVIVLTNAMNGFATAVSNTITNCVLFSNEPRVDFFAEAKDRVTAYKNHQEVAKKEKIEKRKNPVASLPLAAYAGKFFSEVYGYLIMDGPDDKGYFKFWIHGSGTRTGLLSGVAGHWDSDKFGIFEVPWQDIKDYEAPDDIMILEFQDGGCETIHLNVGEYDAVSTFRRVIE
ncbi:hypothetical protein HDU77_010978 [Chytriomyces hyalinus]|nr:hypothetical protein HDU77_010978 [Chytriomyces hyalinus]